MNLKGKYMNINNPVKRFSAGTVKAAVWSNNGTGHDGQPREYKSVSLERSYKDDSGEWQTTKSLRANDIPRARLVLQKAFDFMVSAPDEEELPY